MIEWLIDGVIGGWWIDWLIGWLTDWLVDDWLIKWLIDWLIVLSIEWLINWLIKWMIDWLIDWLIDWFIDWLIDWLSSWLVDCWLVNCLHDPSFFRWNLLPRSLCAGHRQRKANRNYGCLTPGSRPKLWIKPAMRSTWIGRGGIPLKNNLNTISQVLKDVGQFFSTWIFVSLIC